MAPAIAGNHGTVSLRLAETLLLRTTRYYGQKLKQRKKVTDVLLRLRPSQLNVAFHTCRI